MSRRLVSMILVVALIFGALHIFAISANAEISLPVYGETMYTSGNIQYVVNNNEATIVGYTGSSDTVVFPSSINGYAVTRIGHTRANFLEEFMPGFTDVTSVTIPDSVRAISGPAFSGAKKLQNINFGSGLIEIGWSAFNGCSSLKNIDLPDSVVSIAGYAFNNTAWYNSQPNGLLYLGKVLYGYKGTMPSNYTLNVKSGTVSIAASAFVSQSNVVSVVAPDSLEYIGRRAFNDTTWYNKQNNGPVYLGRVLYSYKGTIPSKVTIKEGTVGIAGEAFYDNQLAYWVSDSSANLKSIVLPDSVKNIGEAAFCNCCNLSELSLPAGIKFMGEQAYGFHQAYKGALVKAPANDYPIKVVGYEGTAAQRYAQENDIEFEEIKQTSYLEIYSDRVELSVRKGERIIVGAGIVQDNERVTDISMLSCSVSDPSVLSAISTTTKENCRIYTFDALSPGVTYITFSDSKTGLVKKVPITVYDKNVMAHTVSSVSTQKIEKYTTNFYNVNGLYVDSYTYTENKDGSAVLKFDVYNTNHTYGAVEVFDKDGIMQGAVVIEKMTNNGGSLKSTLWDNTLCIVRDTIDGDWLSYRQESGFSKKTPVEVKVPKDGYIKITIDADESFLVALINGLDIAMSVKSLYGDIKNYDVNSKLFVENLTAELVRNAAYAEFVKDSSEYSKHLMKDFVKESTVFSGKSVGNFADNFVNNLSELKLEELIWDMAEDFGWSTGQSLFEYFSGPVGAAMKGMFLFGDICELAIQNNDLINYTYSGSIVIQNQGGYNRVSSQVKVSSETAFGNEVALRAFEVSVNSREYENIKTFNPELYEKIASVPSQVYNISMIKNGVETQPEGKVEVSIPVPENMKHLARNGRIKVYRIEEDGTRTEMQVKVQNGLLIFNTDHFSLYVIMGDEMLGDVDGDGEVTIMDATEVQLAVAKIITLNEDRNRCADADRDGETTIMDATQIQKFVARVITQL